MAPGRFITLEGGEGSGKSTQIARLAVWLGAQGIEALVTREPGGSPGAEQLRELILEGEVGRWDAVSEALLHFAARRDHVERTVRPALAAGKWVLCDRFTDSSIAYQGHGHELGREAIEVLIEFVLGDFRPDLTLILDIAPDDGLTRARARTEDDTRYERMDSAFHARVRAGFLDIAERDTGRCALIDASAPIEAVAAAVRNTVRERLGVEA